MQKDWADQCSSDEEDERAEDVNPVSIDAPSDDALVAPTKVTSQDDVVAGGDPATRSERVYTYPSEPPFSAYVGNLHFNVNNDILAESIMELTRSVLKSEVKIVQSRVVMDREDRTRSRGFGYVEVETVGDLEKLMELNNCDGALISGRRINLDVSTAPSGNSRRSTNRNSGSNSSSGRSFGGTGPEIDGSKFRHGRYAKKDEGGKPEGGDMRKERPVLILKPRTKAVENGTGADESESNLSTSSSNIFGNAKARDAAGWQERRQSETLQPAATNGDKELSIAPPTPRRDSRGGRGRGGAGGTGRGSARGEGRGEAGRGDRDETGRGRGGKHKNDQKRADKPKQAAPVVAPVVQPKPAEPEKKPAAKANNAFAALALDDSDSD